MKDLYQAMRLPGSTYSIMCTLTEDQILNNPQLVTSMYHAGMRGVRINTAHLDGTAHLDRLTTRLKTLLPDVKILIDTKGPEMRTTSTAQDTEIFLDKGMHVQLQGTSADLPTSTEMIYLNYPLIHRSVGVGDMLLIDDGHIRLVIDDIDDDIIHATVETGGALGSRKGVAVKDIDLPLPPVSDRDRMYIAWAATSPNVDIIAHSFVRSADDVMAVRQAMNGGDKPVIAKIENQQGIDNLHGIIAVSDGILIARGDLTASLGAQAIPRAQSLIASTTKTTKATIRSHSATPTTLPLYLATNILPSLRDSKNVSDTDIQGIHTACSQDVDVFLLTNETAVFSDPILCVQTLSRTLTSRR